MQRFFNLYKYCHDKNYNSPIWQRGLPFDEIENKNKIKFYKKNKTFSFTRFM